MDAYAMLSRPIREYIYEQGWPALTKIQEGAIRYAKQTTANLVLAAPTASGKTEAAFLPAIDAVEKFQTGIRIVYVSPLVALINDQFKRLSALCQTLDIPVFQWHKDVSATRKKRLVKEPRGILLITPESIEAILTIHPEFVSRLFSKVEWVLVDEIHSFIGNDRGYQLRSLLERLQQAMDNEPRYVAMSATLGETDRTFVKSFFFNRRETLVLVDRTQKELEYTLDFVPPTGDYKRDFDRVAQKVYERSRTRSLLVFANSRHTVEDFALRLRKWGVEDRLPIDYFAHYSNLSKALKRSAEVFAKEEGKPFTICCTSTLELGIDIGAVDEVVQYDAPMSVSSLAQRVGRSGRRHTPSRLVLISSEPWLFLQGYAALSLLKRGQLDSVLLVRKPYNVFAHQVLSLVLQRGSIPLDEFRQLNHSMQAWRWVKDDEKTQIFRFLRKQEMIEICGPDVIAGRALETLMEKGSFFSLFEEDEAFGIYAGDEKLAEVVPPPWMKRGSLIVVAGKAWEVMRMDAKKKRVDVVPAQDGRTLKLGIPGVVVSDAIRQEMKAIMERPYDYPDYPVLRQAIQNRTTATFAEDEQGNVRLQTFRGTKINHTLALMLSIVSQTECVRSSEWSSAISLTSRHFDLRKEIEKCQAVSWTKADFTAFFEREPERVEAFLEKTKYRALLPEPIRIEYILENLLDIEGAVAFLATLKTKKMVG
ncbi:DEAD/DEAH box helicase [Dubosiella muris]|uniref:DEAD/DEAH box helicase n=2 Tax=Dubosiella TaxID=1937008 RepID=A0AC61R5H1_9FIRM|nr:DEAD/DEAH box helicase [Dubosiella muris]TGY65028.1 DEAD/DEAH box helicase [Dubosiella muris]